MFEFYNEETEQLEWAAEVDMSCTRNGVAKAGFMVMPPLSVSLQREISLEIPAANLARDA